jgi:hypothetical protein
VEFIETLRDQPPERSCKTIFISAGNYRARQSTTNARQRSDASRLALGGRHSPLPGGITADNINARGEK